MEKIHAMLFLAVLSYLSAVERGQSLPMPAPNLTLCHTPVYLPDGVPAINCCPPYLNTVIDFEFPTNLPVRIRPSAHTVDSQYIEKYSRAVEIMRGLPSDDPRSFHQQSNVHCAYCSGAYNTGNLSLVLDVHSSWFFLAWHRWYLYFHERILASLIGDDTFALPFWNWDGPSAITIPPMYAQQGPLFDAVRDAAHKPPKPVDFDYDGSADTQQSLESLIESNNAVMYRHVVSNARTTQLFQGMPNRYGDDPTELVAGTLEDAPHGPVHTWVGSRNQSNLEDMGELYSAGRDPIFYAHHANVDRLWTVWKTLDGGTRRDYNDTDFLEARFLFYNEKSQLVSVRLGDALDPSKLRYSYQTVDMPWLNWQPTKTARVPSSLLGGSKSVISGTLGDLIDSLTTTVKRPNPHRPEAQKKRSEEVLLIHGIKLSLDRVTKFHVFINLPEANPTTSIDRAEYAGTFFYLPQPVHLFKLPKIGKVPKVRPIKSSFRLGITAMLEELSADLQENILVTVVHQGVSIVPIEIAGVKITFDSSGLV